MYCLHFLMQLEKAVMAQGNVEVWLGTLLQMSRKSVHSVIRTAHTAVQDQGFNLLEFLSTFPAQVFKGFFWLSFRFLPLSLDDFVW